MRSSQLGLGLGLGLGSGLGLAYEVIPVEYARLGAFEGSWGLWGLLLDCLGLLGSRRCFCSHLGFDGGFGLDFSQDLRRRLGTKKEKGL